MNFSIYLQLLLVGLCLISGIVFLMTSIFNGKEKQINYDYIISELNKKQEEDLKLIQKRNKEIDKLEQKISTYKKILHMNSVKKKA